MKKRKMSFLLMSFLALGAWGAMHAAKDDAVKAKAATVNIGSLDEFKSVFDKGAAHTASEINLTADIDVSSYLGTVENGGQCGMAGTFTGTFNGNGHVISGIGATGGWGANAGGMFNIIGPAGTVKNLVIDWTATRDNIGSIAYKNEGKFENVTVITRVPESPNCFGAFVAQEGGGTYVNCNSHFIVTGGMGAGVGAVSFGGSPSSVTDCSFSRIGGADHLFNTQGFGTIESLDKIYASSTQDVAVGDTLDLNKFTYGIPGTWKSSDTAVATVENGVVTPLKSGTVEITAEMSSEYASNYPNNKSTHTVTVSSASNVTGVDIVEDKVSVFATKTTTLTATLTGNIYESVTWTSKNLAVATVEGDGLSATVTGVAEGSAEIEISVVSGNGVTYKDTATVEVADFKVIVNEIPKADDFAPRWEGAGILGMYLDPNGFVGNITDYKLEVNVTNKGGSAGFTLAGYTFQNQNSRELYSHYSYAPAANTGLYAMTFTLVNETNSAKYVYESTYLFDGTTYVVIEGSITGESVIGLNNSETYTASFNYYSGTKYEWSVDDNTVVKLDDSDSNVVVATGLKVGTTTITCKINDDGVEYTVTKEVEVVSKAFNVTEIRLDQESISLKEGKTAVVNLEFVEGSLYNSINWEVGSNDVATVDGDGKSAVISAVGVGNTTLTVTVSTDGGEVKTSINIEVLEAAKMNLYFAIPDDFYNIGTDGYALVFYSKVEETKVDLVDTGIDIVLYNPVTKAVKAAADSRVASVYKGVLNLDNLNVINEGAPLYFQVCSTNNTGTRWGAGINFDENYNAQEGAIMTLNNWNGGNGTLEVLGTEKDADEAVDFVSKWRALFKGISICDAIANRWNEVEALIEEYDALDNGVKVLVNDTVMIDLGIVDTFADHIQWVRDSFGAGNKLEADTGANKLLTRLTHSNAIYMVAIVAGLVLVSFVGYTIISKKKLEK